MLARVSKATDLPFVQGSNMWVPERSGDYETDNAMGRFYAQELVRYMQRADSPNVFGYICRAMFDAGKFDGVEIGFCSVIGITIVSAETAIATVALQGKPIAASMPA